MAEPEDNTIRKITKGIPTKEETPPVWKRLKSKHYLLITLSFIVSWQVIFMFLWVVNATEPITVDFVLMRFSLSNSDAMSISAWALALWSMYILEKNQQELEEKYSKKVEELTGLDNDTFKIIMEELSKLDKEHLRSLVRSYVQKANQAKTYEDMQKDFDIDFGAEAKKI